MLLSELMLWKVYKGKNLDCTIDKSPLKTLSIVDIIRCIMYMAKYVNIDGKHHRFRALMSSKFDNEIAHLIFTSTVKLFINWPHNFVDFLTEYQDPNNNRNGIRGKFGNLYGVLDMQLSEEQFKFLREGFQIYFESQWFDKSLFFLKKKNVRSNHYVSKKKGM